MRELDCRKNFRPNPPALLSPGHDVPLPFEFTSRENQNATLVDQLNSCNWQYSSLNLAPSGENARAASVRLVFAIPVSRRKLVNWPYHQAFPVDLGERMRLLPNPP